MTYDCMTPDELELWKSSARGVRLDVGRPCVDCPRWFEKQAREAGCCSRTRTPQHRLEQMRERYRRVHGKAYNDVAGTSSSSTIPDAVPLLVPGGTASSV